MTAKVFGIFQKKTRKHYPPVIAMKCTNTNSLVMNRFLFQPIKNSKRNRVLLSTQSVADIWVLMCSQRGTVLAKTPKNYKKIGKIFVSPPPPLRTK